MRAVVQRVTRAEVRVDGIALGTIQRGLCVLVGVGEHDDQEHARKLAEKVVGLRVFEDEAGKMNRALKDVGGGLLAISQFTLFGDVRKGMRPSFTAARSPSEAEALFEAFCSACRALHVPVQTGRFRADMQVELINDGPVTILIDTERSF